MAKRSFFKAANAVFGKIGGRASEEVITQIIRTKCMPVLLYGLEACPLRKSDINSLSFVVNRFFMKLFRTSNIDIVNYCRAEFNFELPGILSLNNVLVNLEINIVHVTIFIVNCCV